MRGRLRGAVRRGAYPLAALPLDIACVTLLAFGRPVSAVRLQEILGGLSGGATTAGKGPPRRPSIGTFALRLPLDIVAFFLAGYVWLLLPMNWAFPLRTGTDPDSLADSWGGPTLAGAWTLHAAGGTLVFLVVGLPLLSGMTWCLEKLGPTLRPPA